jgi:hypothetical protein
VEWEMSAELYFSTIHMACRKFISMDKVTEHENKCFLAQQMGEILNYKRDLGSFFPFKKEREQNVQVKQQRVHILCSAIPRPCQWQSLCTTWLMS